MLLKNLLLDKLLAHLDPDHLPNNYFYLHLFVDTWEHMERAWILIQLRKPLKGREEHEFWCDVMPATGHDLKMWRHRIIFLKTCHRWAHFTLNNSRCCCMHYCTLNIFEQKSVLHDSGPLTHGFCCRCVQSCKREQPANKMILCKDWKLCVMLMGDGDS